MTKKMRVSHLFCRRIIIPIPSWGLLPVSLAIIIGLIGRPMLVTNIISVSCATVSIILVIVARRQVRALKHDVHEALHNINADDDDDEDDDTPVPYPTDEHITLKKMNVNGTASARVSEH
jgi:hypothetical protein